MNKKPHRNSSSIPRLAVAVLSCIAFIFLPGCASYDIADLSKYRRNGIQYGATQGTFRPRWWSYYERGRSFADGGFLDEAERDLREALARKSIDDRRSRTYGLHYTHYFGNRELGVLLYRRGRYNDAIRYLNKSLSQDPSEKTEFYLNKCQQELSRNKSDFNPPAIKLDILPGLTNTPRLIIAGFATDDRYVDSIRINDRTIAPILKQSRLEFRQLIDLRSGPNTITIVATDTAGNETQESHEIILDSEPPLISLIPVPPSEIVLSVKDALPVDIDMSATVNLEVVRRVGNQFTLRTRVGADFYYAEFQDTANNRNGIRIDADALKLGCYRSRNSPASSQRASPILLASTDLSSAYLTSRVTQNERALNDFQIEIEHLRPKMKVYQDHLLVSGRVSGEFKSVVFDRQTKIHNGKNTRFAFSKYLEPGRNQFNLEITSRDNKKSTHSFTIDRLPEPEDDRELRARLMLCPIANARGGRGLTSNVFANLLVSLHKHRRFRIVETKHRDLIDEAQKLIRDGWIRASSAARVGKIRDADYSLACTIRPTETEVEIFGRLIDTATGKVLVAFDAFEVTKSDVDYANVYNRFVKKLSQSFPVVQETISKIHRGKVVLDVGHNANIRDGMKFLAFHRGKPLVDSETGQVLIKGIINVDGELSTEKVEKNGTRLKRMTAGGLEKSEFVVSM